MGFDRYASSVGMEFNGLDDEAIVTMANKGNEKALEYLIYKYKDFVKSKARSYYIIGGDRDDIIQEGMIGLYKAIKGYENEKFASFRNFADICVTRQMITAIKTATRQKHKPLNSYVSLNKPIFGEGSNPTIEDTVRSGRITDPMELFIGKEELDRVESKINGFLSSLEKEVLMSYVEGRSYEEIATDLNVRVKSIDNALQRVKKKIERYYFGNNEY